MEVEAEATRATAGGPSPGDGDATSRALEMCFGVQNAGVGVRRVRP